MQSDEHAVRHGQAYRAESDRVPGHPPDELDEAADRLEEAHWDDFEGADHESADPAQAEERHGPVVSFLDQQLREHPIPTLAAALVAGWLVGKLLR